MDNQEIKIGDTVRSFDFDSRDEEGNQACFVEGVVEEIGKLPFTGFSTCDHYHIKCTKKIFGGESIAKFEEYYFPPKNGTPKMMGGVCDHVKLIK